jgi:hypothetical protein
MKSLSITDFRLPLLLGSSVPRKLLVAAAATGFADWLFYEHRIGVSLALFLLALAILSLLTHPSWTSRRETLIAVTVLIAGVAPLVEAFNVLSALYGVAALALVVSSQTNPFIENLRDRLAAARTLLLTGPFRLLSDVIRSRIWAISPSQLTAWVIPLLLGTIFLALFASANPLIENMLAAFDPQGATSRISFMRLLFWCATVTVIWPFVSLRWENKPTGRRLDMVEPEPVVAGADPFTEQLFGLPAILRSLVVFNLLFAVQTTLDLTYLWGGVALPDGMTYASYAHRGAYPLMLTALLAAGFVLLAMRPSGPAQRIPSIRGLVFVFVAQNVMLVVSSMLRLDLYVETYSLTYWRLATLIWMLLVAVGLVLIVARIALDHSNQWLVLANAVTLALVLYVCAFINFPWVIATYNVAHSREMSGKGVAVDFHYLVHLGPQALPAIDHYLDHDGRPCCAWKEQRDGLVLRHAAQLDSWRAWSFRGWRLQRYLDQAAEKSVAAP